MGSVFRSSEFRRFYAGQALSYLGDGLRTLAICMALAVKSSELEPPKRTSCRAAP